MSRLVVPVKRPSWGIDVGDASLKVIKLAYNEGGLRFWSGTNTNIRAIYRSPTLTPKKWYRMPWRL